MRFMGPLSDEDISVLQDHYLHSEKPATRRRSHAIFLSNKQFTMDQIAVILEVTRETVGHWFNSWEAQGIDGLHDKVRSGRVPIYNESDIDQLETLLKESPHQLKTAQARLEKNAGKQSCGETLKRALKKAIASKEPGISWEKEERCALYFFDESDFSQKSALPYVWSPSGQSVEIPARSHSQRLNVLGFLNRGGSLFYQATTDSVTTDVVIEAFEQFIARKDPETLSLFFWIMRPCTGRWHLNNVAMSG